MTTLDPALANRIAVEAPIPDDAPVIRAELSAWAGAGQSEEQGNTGQDLGSRLGTGASREQVGSIVRYRNTETVGELMEGNIPVLPTSLEVLKIDIVLN
jgi:hypothetical protein